MKNFFLTRLLACLATLLLVGSSGAWAAPFTPGNLVVVRIGDGSAALTSAATATYLLEYTPAGVLVQTIALPTTAVGTNSILTNTGSSSTDALLTRSANGAYLVITGYDAAVGTAGVAGTTSAANNRIIGRIAADGTFDTSTRLSDGFSGGNIRSAATVDGTAFWSVGSTGGVRYTPLGNASTSTVVTAVPSNNRGVGIYGGDLYVSSATGTGGNFYGISQVGTGLPTTTSQTSTPLAGFPVASGPSPYGFYFADLSTTVAGVDVVYVADDRTTVDGGIQKWSLVAGTWTLNGVITGATPTTAGPALRGLNGRVSGTTVTLAASSSSALYVITDNAGYNATPTDVVLPASIASTTTNTAFRGVAYAPVAPAAAPTITSFTPTTGAAGTTVTITGTNFTGVTAVTVNGVNITGFTYVNATTITFTVPATATSGTIAVTTPGGTATSTGVFTFVPPASAPTISTFSPPSGPVGTTVTVTGTNFTGATGATINGVPGTNFTVISATSLRFDVPPAATTGLIVVTTPAGTATSGTVFTVTTAGPTITSFTPVTGPVGTTVTITGTGFIGVTDVTVGGATATGFTVVNPTTIQFNVPATAATGPISVTTAGGTATSTTNFTVTPSVAVPVITALTPGTQVAGGPAVTLMITGTGFTPTSTVNFNNVSYSQTTSTATTIEALIPASVLTTAGSYPVTVTNTAGTSNAFTFTVNNPSTAGAFEDFETGTKTSYAVATVTLASGTWTFSDALIGTAFNDRANGLKSARIRVGFIRMDFDKPNGAGTVIVNAGSFGVDAPASFILEKSIDGGTTFTTVPGAPAVLTNTLTPYTFTVNQSGNVRFRITSTATATNTRINIDDISISNFTGSATRASQALPGLAVFPNPAADRLTVHLPTAAPATVALRDLTGRLVLAPAALGADQQLVLPAALARGVYLLEVRQDGVTAVRRIEKN